jgi:hypothetical protein
LRIKKYGNFGLATVDYLAGELVHEWRTQEIILNFTTSND